MKVRKTLKVLCKFIAEKLFGINNCLSHFFLVDLGTNPVIVDAGASTSYFIKTVISKNHQARAVLIEPDPIFAKQLKVEFRETSQVKLIEAALGFESKDSINFYLSEEPDFNSIYERFSEQGQKRKHCSMVKVPMVTIADVCRLHNIEKISLLKLDIEGAEWDMIDQFSEKDFERIDQISVEFHEFLDSAHLERSKQCIDKLSKLGYSFVYQGYPSIPERIYYNCLFYKKKCLARFRVSRWIGIPSIIVRIIR
jgi:FkbM family methyltransferase